MSYVYLNNKKNGTTYVYESVGHWNKEKQTCICERKCVGKLDPVTGEIIFSKMHMESNNQLKVSQGPSQTLNQGIVFMVQPICLTRLARNSTLQMIFKGAFRIHTSRFFHLRII